MAAHHLSGYIVIVTQRGNRGNGVPLTVRYSVNGAGEFHLSETWKILPSFLFLEQGGYDALTLGASIRKTFGDRYSRKYIQIGLFGRASSEDSIGVVSDGGFFNINLNLKRFSLGLTFEGSSTDLRQAGSFDSAAEITLGYIFGRQTLQNVVPIKD